MDSISPSPLGERLRQTRERAGIAARELDRIAGITEGHTTLIESGRRRDISGRTLASLAEALGAESRWLLGGVGKEPTDDDLLRAVEAARHRLVSATGTE